MAGEFNIPLGAINTGKVLYGNVFDPAWVGLAMVLDVAHTVWNGTAFVTDAWAARNLGAIACPESGTTGTYIGNFPVGITTTGTYPITVKSRTGGSYNAQTDPSVIYAGQTIFYAGSGPFVDMTYTPSTPANGTRPSINYFANSGVPIRITPDTPTAITLANWEVRIGVVGAATYDSFTVANGKLTGDASTGILYANPTAALSATWSRSSLQIEVWNVATDDVQDVYGRARISLKGTLHP